LIHRFESKIKLKELKTIYINEIIKDHSVEFIKGIYEGERGSFKLTTGYTDRYGCVCEIFEKDPYNYYFVENVYVVRDAYCEDLENEIEEDEDIVGFFYRHDIKVYC